MFRQHGERNTRRRRLGLRRVATLLAGAILAAGSAVGYALLNSAPAGASTQSVESVAVSLSSTVAEQTTAATTTFTTSSDGALLASTGTITLSVPDSYLFFPSVAADYVLNGVEASAVMASGDSVTITVPDALGDSAQVTVVASGVTNPPAGTYEWLVSTSSDPTPVPVSFGITATGSGSAPAVVSSFTDPSIVDPQGIATGSDGALWFTNFGTGTFQGSIGRITTAGVVTNYTDPSISLPIGITAGPDGALWFANQGNDSIGRIATAGVVTNYTDPSIGDPTSIAAGPDGAVWFTNHGNNSIGRITTAGVVTNYTDPSISFPIGITAGPDGALWFTNEGATDQPGRTARSDGSPRRA